MRRGIVLMLLAVSIMLPGLAPAAPAKPEPVEAVASVLAEIRRSQGLAEDARIDVSRVSEDQLEKLGEAVMQARPGAARLRDWTDSLAGSADSSTRAKIQRRIGRRFLEGKPAIGPGLVRRGMGRMMHRRWRQPGLDSLHARGMLPPHRFAAVWKVGMVWAWGFVVLIWTIMVLAIILLVRALTRGGKPEGASALDILKARYAKGEVTRDEYEATKRDLT